MALLGRTAVCLFIALPISTCTLAQTTLPVAAPVTQPTTQPSTEVPEISPEVAAAAEKLIAQFSSDSWRMRQKAQDDLVQMGQDVRPFLLRLLAQTRDEEVRTRAEAALRQIDDNRASGISLITLHLKQAHPKRIFAELSRQANTSLHTSPPNLWDSRQWPLIDLDVERQPFWVAMKEICGKLRVTPQSTGMDMVITDANAGGRAFGDLPTVVSGPFVVIATNLSTTRYVDLNQPNNIRRSTSMQCMVYAEPKLRVLQGSTTPRVELAEDEKGNSLVFPGVSSEYLQPAYNWAWNLHIALNPKNDAGQRIAHLKGTARYVIQTRAASAEIPNVMSSRNITKNIGAKKFLFKQAIRKGEMYEVQLTLYRSGWNPNEWTYRAPVNNFRLIDTAGNPLMLLNPGFGGGGDQYDLNLMFQRQGGNAEPSRLVWEVPIETKELTVPFEFADLPLP